MTTKERLCINEFRTISPDVRRQWAIFVNDELAAVATLYYDVLNVITLNSKLKPDDFRDYQATYPNRTILCDALAFDPLVRRNMLAKTTISRI